MKLKSSIKIPVILGFLSIMCYFATCRYSTKDISPIPPEIKTFRVNYFENKARYVDPQVTPQLTQKVIQEILGQTRLRQTNNDDAGYDISGYLSDYSFSTSGVANSQASTNRLNVTFHLIFKNTLDNTKDFEADLTSNYDFPSTQTLQQATTNLLDQIIKTTADAIFNRIFSNW